MSLQVSAQRIRFPVNISEWMNSTAPTDVISEGAVTIANGADLQLEMLFADGTPSDLPSNIIDFTDIQSVVIALASSANPHSANIYWSVNIANSDITNAVTAAAFNATQPNTTAQITAKISHVLNAMALTGPSNPYWLLIYGLTAANVWASSTFFATGQLILDNNGNIQEATVGGTSGSSVPVWNTNTSGTTTDNGITWTNLGSGNSSGVPSASQVVPYAAFTVTVIDTGIPVPNPTLPSPFKVGSTLAFVCSDGLTRTVAVQQQANGLWTTQVNQAGTNSAGQASYAVYCSDGFWRNLTVQLINSVWTLDVAQTGHT